jgi:hypothetical protein
MSKCSDLWLALALTLRVQGNPWDNKATTTMQQSTFYFWNVFDNKDLDTVMQAHQRVDQDMALFEWCPQTLQLVEGLQDARAQLQSTPCEKWYLALMGNLLNKYLLIILVSIIFNSSLLFEFSKTIKTLI